MSMNPKNQKQISLSENDFQLLDREYSAIQYRYMSAIREVKTKLEILDDEYRSTHQRNPIHHMQSRLKSSKSMYEKLQRKGFPCTMASAAENLTDIAGIRVICNYIDDIYAIAELLTGQDDVKVIKKRDYIKDPKENGYRSLHLVVQIPIFLQEGKIPVPVEVQIRTIAMDFWATLEHHLGYKGLTAIPEDIADELSNTAKDISMLDQRMLRIRNRVDAIVAFESFDQ